MKNKIIILLLTISIFILPLSTSATEEINVEENFKNFCSIIFPKDTNNIVNNLAVNGTIAVDYSVSIIKNKPLSLEAFYTIYFLPKVFNGRMFKEKFENFKEKHMPNIKELNFEPYEKIVFLLMLLSPVAANNYEEFQANAEMSKKILNDMKISCEDKNYAALANIALLWNKSEKTNNLNYFKENFPNHPAIPIVELELKSIEYENNTQICIDEIQKLINKYGEIETPLGYKIKDEYLNSLTYCYIKMGDYENASKCVELIKKEAPNYRNLNNLIDRIEKQK